MQAPQSPDDVEGAAEVEIPVADTSTGRAETPPERSAAARPRSRARPLLLRRWLRRRADDGDIAGLEWVDRDRRTLLRIPWCHGSRSEWSQEHSALFRAWAQHKGPCAISLESHSTSFPSNHSD